MRKISVKGKSYEYRVGRAFTRIRFAPDYVDPKGKTVYVPNHELIGVSPATFERGQWKQTTDGSVMPKHLRSYIETATL